MFWFLLKVQNAKRKKKNKTQRVFILFTYDLRQNTQHTFTFKQIQVEFQMLETPSSIMSSGVLQISAGTNRNCSFKEKEEENKTTQTEVFKWKIS